MTSITEWIQLNPSHFSYYCENWNETGLDIFGIIRKLSKFLSKNNSYL